MLLTPVFIALLIRPYWGRRPNHLVLANMIRLGLFFCLISFILGILTLMYNQLRFGSLSDFGYARIPGVLNEPLYHNGIFSLLPVGENARQMLVQGWKHLSAWPYLVPSGFGGSILIASPFLLLLLRRPREDGFRIILSVISIAILTTLLWVHGNPGGWQSSYRYAEELLPWVLLIFIEYLPARITRLELALSISMNAYSTYLFMWTNFVQP